MKPSISQEQLTALGGWFLKAEDEEFAVGDQVRVRHGTVDPDYPDLPLCLTEINHLGNVAYRTGKKIEWDPAILCAKNAPEANRFIRCNYRQGWMLL